MSYALKEYIVLVGLTVIAALFNYFWIRSGNLQIQKANADDLLNRTKAALAVFTAAYFTYHHVLYVIALGFIYFWFIRRRSLEEQAGYFFLLAFLIPLYQWPIPFPGINKILDLDTFRIFIFLVFIPMLVSFNRDHKTALFQNPVDKYIIIYVLMIIIPKIRFLTFTGWLRLSTELLIDHLIVYFVISRLARRPSALRQIALSLAFIGIFFAGMSVIEGMKNWHLYEAIPSLLKIDNVLGDYGPTRSGWLRAYGSFHIPIAFGVFLQLIISSQIAVLTVATYQLRKLLLASILILVFGLILTFSRTPLFGLGVFLITFFPLRYWHDLPRLFAKTVFIAPVVALSLFFFASTNVGRTYLKTIPGIGNEAEESFTYRESLRYAVNSYLEDAPLFGEADFLDAEELQLRSGDLSIDLTNSYLQIAVYHGSITMYMFIFILVRLGLLLIPLLFRQRIRRYAVYYQFIFAMLVAYTAMIYAVSQVSFLPDITFIIFGLCAGCIDLDKSDVSVGAAT